MNDEALATPFVGERYAPSVRLTDVVAPPYDVIDDAERRALGRRDPRNVAHVILPGGDGDRYANAATTLADWRRAGTLVADPRPAVYVVRQRFTAPGGATHVRTGVIAAVAAEPFARGRVKPHERTHAGPKQDRLDLLRATETMCEALLMLARDTSGALGSELATATATAPLAQANLAGVEISLWRVDGPSAVTLAVAAGSEPLYVADGHHRYETTVAYRGENARAARTLALIVAVADPGLLVLPTHRLIAGTRVTADVLQHMSEYAVVEPLGPRDDVQRALATLPPAGGGCVVVLEGTSYRLTRRRGAGTKAVADFPPVVASLDVAWADTVVVPPLSRAAGAEQLRYTADLDAALRVMRAGEAVAAVLLNPPLVQQVLAVADAGAIMPPKATFFTPKVPSGLVFLNYHTRP